MFAAITCDTAELSAAIDRGLTTAERAADAVCRLSLRVHLETPAGPAHPLAIAFRRELEMRNARVCPVVTPWARGHYPALPQLAPDCVISTASPGSSPPAIPPHDHAARVQFALWARPLRDAGDPLGRREPCAFEFPVPTQGYLPQLGKLDGAKGVAFGRRVDYYSRHAFSAFLIQLAAIGRELDLELINGGFDAGGPSVALDAWLAHCWAFQPAALILAGVRDALRYSNKVARVAAMRDAARDAGFVDLCPIDGLALALDPWVADAGF